MYALSTCKNCRIRKEKHILKKYHIYKEVIKTICFIYNKVQNNQVINVQDINKQLTLF